MTVQGQQLDLMPCPFCGGTARIGQPIFIEPHGSFSVACSECGARRGDFFDGEMAERIWNMRYFSPQQIQAIRHSEKNQSGIEDSKAESVNWIIRIFVPFILFISSYYCVTHFESFIISAGYGDLLSPSFIVEPSTGLIFVSVFFSVTIVELLFLSAFSFLSFVNSLVSFFVAKMESRSAQSDRGE